MKVLYIGENKRHAPAVRHVVQTAVAQTGHELVEVTGRHSTSESSSFEHFRETLEEADLVIADVSDLDWSTSLAIGAVLQLQKPLISLARSGTEIQAPALQSGPYLTYEGNESIGSIIERLKPWIEKALSVQHGVAAAAVPLVERGHKLFVSYSHKDRQYLDRLLVHLRPLERAGKIELWSDNKIRVGDRWRAEIQTALERSTVAVLLLSADFMASEFIVQDELPPLLKAAEERGVRILPLVVKPCRFLRDPSLSQFQSANLPSTPFIMLSEGEQEGLLDQLAGEVERFVGAA